MKKLKFSLTDCNGCADSGDSPEKGIPSSGIPKRFMMSDFANRKSPKFVISVKFTLIALVAALLSAGMFVTAADDVMNPTAPISKGNSAKSSDSIPKSNSTEGHVLPATLGSGKILTSLRFWEKNKSQPQPQQPASSSPIRPQETEKGSVHANTLTSKQPSAMAVAPEPVPNNSPAEHERMGFGDAPLPVAQFVNDYPESENAFSQDVPPVTTSYVSYSFDTRDWVEHFPCQQAPEPPVQKNTLMATQPTSLRSPTLEPPQNWNDAPNNQWDGQATTLVARIHRDPVPPTVTPAVITSATTESVGQPLVDLSPSYQKRLPYVQTCGVVVVQANFPLMEIASILDEINQLQYDLNRYIGVPAPKEKIELCLFKSEETYIAFLREFFPRAPGDRRALYVKLDNKPGTLMVQKSKDFEIDLRHEMTHAIIHTSIPKVPIWLDEGLAKYFEVPIQDRAGEHPYMSPVRWNAKLGVVPSLDRLTKLETIDDMGTKEYRDSWAWTHFLIHRSPETHRLLAAYLQMLAQLSFDGEYEGTSHGLSVGSGSVIKTIFEKEAGTTKNVPIPSLKLYLDDIMTNQRETFKEHFGVVEK